MSPRTHWGAAYQTLHLATTSLCSGTPSKGSTKSQLVRTCRRCVCVCVHTGTCMLCMCTCCVYVQYVHMYRTTKTCMSIPSTLLYYSAIIYGSNPCLFLKRWRFGTCRYSSNLTPIIFGSHVFALCVQWVSLNIIPPIRITY